MTLFQLIALLFLLVLYVVELATVESNKNEAAQLESRLQWANNQNSELRSRCAEVAHQFVILREKNVHLESALLDEHDETSKLKARLQTKRHKKTGGSHAR